MITILIASTTTKSTRNAESVLFDNLHTIEHFITSEIGILLHIFSNRIILGDVTSIADLDYFFLVLKIRFFPNWKGLFEKVVFNLYKSDLAFGHQCFLTSIS